MREERDFSLNIQIARDRMGIRGLRAKYIPGGRIPTCCRRFSFSISELA
jgi:hypothetical protein